MRMVEVMTGLTPGFIKPTPVAWCTSHRHDIDGTNEPYAYAYLLAYGVDLPAGARTLTLPYNDRIPILVLTVAEKESTVPPAHSL